MQKIFLPFFISLPFLIWLPIYNEAYYVPKLFAIFALGIYCSYILVTNKNIHLARSPTLFISLYFIWALISLIGNTDVITSLIHLAALFVCAQLFFVVSENSSIRKNILLSIVIVGLIQSLYLIIQFFIELDIATPMTTIRSFSVAGTVGNAEFLSYLLGAAIFSLLYLNDENKIISKNITIVLLVFLGLAIVLSKSKGTLFFFVVYFLWRYLNSKVFISIISVSVIALIFVVWPDSVNGRLLLWLSGSEMALEHWMSGVGYRQFEHYHLNIIYTLFSNSSSLLHMFGAHSAMAKDAHNIFIMHAAEMGIIGLVMSIILFSTIYRLALVHRHSYLAGPLFLGLFKSLYTVMLGSLLGALIFSVFVALLYTNEGKTLHVNSVMKRIMAGALIIVYLISGYVADADRYFRKGQIHLFRGELDLAEKAFEISLQRNQQDFNNYLGFAYIRFKQYEYEEMNKYLNKAIHYRKNMDSLKKSAHFYFNSGQYAKARPIYEFLLICYPQHLTSMAKLSMIYVRAGEEERSRQMAKRVLATQPRVHSNSDSSNRDMAKEILRDLLN